IEESRTAEHHGLAVRAAESVRAHGFEQAPIVVEGLLIAEMLMLNQISASELIEDEVVGLVGHRDVAHEDRAVLEHAVTMRDALDRRARQAKDTGGWRLEVTGASPAGYRSVAPASGAFTRVDVEVVDGARRARGGRGQEAPRREESERAPGARHYLA